MMDTLAREFRSLRMAGVSTPIVAVAAVSSLALLLGFDHLRVCRGL